MSWILALYVWGIGASSIVNNTKSLLALWYAKTEDKEYYNSFMKKSEDEKIAFFAKNIIKTFIPVYNIVHPIKMLLESKLPSLLHPIKSLKYNGKIYLTKWRMKELDSKTSKEKFNNKVKKVSNWFDKTKKEVNKEKEKMLEKKKSTASSQTKKVEPTAEKSTTPLPQRNGTSEQKVETISEIDSKISALKKEYVVLKKEYDVLKAKGASAAEKNKVARRINQICADTNALIERRKTLKNNKPVVSNKPVTTSNSENKSNLDKHSADLVREMDATMAMLRKDFSELKKKYIDLSTKGGSKSEKDKLVKEMQRVADEYNELYVRRSSLVAQASVSQKPEVKQNPAVKQQTQAVKQTSKQTTNNSNNGLNPSITIDVIDAEIQKLMNEQTLLAKEYLDSVARGASTQELKKIDDKRDINSKRISYLMSYRRNLIAEGMQQPTSGGMTLRR